MSETDFISRQEFEKYRREVENKFDKVHSETQQVLIEIAKIGERFGNFNEKITDIKDSIDKKLDSFKGDIQVIQNDFMDNLKEPKDRLSNLKWAIVGSVCSGLVMALLTFILK